MNNFNHLLDKISGKMPWGHKDDSIPTREELERLGKTEKLAAEKPDHIIACKGSGIIY